MNMRSKNVGVSPHIGAAIAHLFTQKFGNPTMQVAHAITSLLQGQNRTSGTEMESPQVVPKEAWSNQF